MADWQDDRIVDLEQQLEHERDRRIVAERELERLTSPACVLAEAERLLREAGAQFIYLSQADGGQTMVEAFEKLTGGRDG